MPGLSELCLALALKGAGGLLLSLLGWWLVTDDDLGSRV